MKLTKVQTLLYPLEVRFSLTRVAWGRELGWGRCNFNPACCSSVSDSKVDSSGTMEQVSSDFSSRVEKKKLSILGVSSVV